MQTRENKVTLRVVTDSEVATWNSCPQLHHFKYRERLRPLVDAKALAMGSITHVGMKNGLRAGWSGSAASKPRSERIADQVSAATASIDALVHEWAAKIVLHSKEKVDFEKLEVEAKESASLVKWMLANYFRATAADLDDLVLVDTERPFTVGMVDKAGRPVLHLGYSGVIDVEFYDPAYNQYVLGDHKTTAGNPRDIEKRVEMDTQTAGYLWAMRKRLDSTEVRLVGDGAGVVPKDAQIGRVMYNVLRKSEPRPPKVNQDGRVSVAQCVTTADLYRAALHEQVATRGIAVTEPQAKFAQALTDQGDRFFARVEWNRTRADVERWRSDTFANASRIREADRDPSRRTRNTGHCNMPWSLPCRYRQLCLDPESREIRAQFRVAGDVHTEVRDAETEVAV